MEEEHLVFKGFVEFIYRITNERELMPAAEFYQINLYIIKKVLKIEKDKKLEGYLDIFEKLILIYQNKV